MAWLGTWAKRIEITVDNTNIDSDLTQCSAAVVLGTSVGQSAQDLSGIFDEVGSDSLKIAITKADGTTQIYGDIELWGFKDGIKGTPNATRDLGSSDDGNAGLSVLGSPIDNGTYYTFDGSSTGLYNSTNLGDTATEICWAKVRIHDKDKGAAQTIWKDGGSYKGVAVGINASGDLGIFGRNSNTLTSITIPSTSYENDVWYDIFFTDVDVFILNSDTQELVASASGTTLNPASGTEAESIGYAIDSSPISGTTSTSDYFDGDIADIEIYTEEYLIAPVYEEKAVIHVAKSDLVITAASTTTLYIYYDSAQADNTTYISASGATAAQSVWDSNFKLVQHMNQDPSGSSPQLLDSTSNNLDGTSVGTMLTEDLVDGTIGKALDFDGGDDYIDLGTTPLIDSTLPFTINCLVNNGAFANSYPPILAIKTDQPQNWTLLFSDNAGYSDITFGCQVQDWYWPNLKTGSIGLATGTPYLVTVVYNGNGWQVASNYKLYIDAVEKSLVTGMDFTSNTEVSKIGGGVAGTYWDGIIDEVQISDIDRSAAWVKATYYSLTDDLLTYGSEELIPITQVETPVIAPTSGEYESSQEITITCGTSGSTIYYTEDGSTPDATDTEYTAPFTLGSAKTIKAIGIKIDLDDSNIVSETYTISAGVSIQPMIFIIT